MPLPTQLNETILNLGNSLNQGPSLQEYQRPCENCRKIKKRCSKELPSCKKCLKKGIKCIYPEIKKNKMEEWMLELSVSGIYKELQFKGDSLMPINKNLDLKLKGQSFQDLNKKSLINRKKEHQLIDQKNNTIKNIKIQTFDQSMVDKGNIIFIVERNKPIYYGRSPAGNLMTLFFSIQSSTTFQDVIKINLKTDSKTKSMYCLSQLESPLSKQLEVDACIKAYFEHFNPYCPIITMNYFKNYASPLLKRAIILIGSKYLNKQLEKNLIQKLDSQVRLLFLKEYFKPSLDLVIIICLLCQYQIIAQEFKNMWYHQIHGIHIAKLLGLHLKHNYKLDDKEFQLMRERIWWACLIRERMFAFALNRPLLIGLSTLNINSNDYDKGLENNFINLNNDSLINRNFIQDQLSFIYWRSLAELSELMGEAIILKRVKYSQTSNLDEAYQSFEKFQTKLDAWHSKLIRSMGFFDQTKRNGLNFPQWLRQLKQRFIAHLLIIKHSVIIQVSHPFLTVTEENGLSKYSKVSLESANAIVLLCQELGNSFFQHGILYRFYALCLACLYHLHLSQVKDLIILDQCNYYLNMGLRILKMGTQYYEFVNEYYRMMYNLFLEKGISIDLD